MNLPGWRFVWAKPSSDKEQGFEMSAQEFDPVGSLNLQTNMILQEHWRDIYNDPVWIHAWGVVTSAATIKQAFAKLDREKLVVPAGDEYVTYGDDVSPEEALLKYLDFIQTIESFEDTNVVFVHNGYAEDGDNIVVSPCDCKFCTTEPLNEDEEPHPYGDCDEDLVLQAALWRRPEEQDD